jgi:hypothetical protein
MGSGKIPPVGGKGKKFIDGTSSCISEQLEENSMIFPKVTFTLDRILRHMGALFCNWK